MMSQADGANQESAGAVNRRDALGVGTSVVMAGGLIASYGTLVAFAGRFLFSSSAGGETVTFVAPADEFAPDTSMPFTSPGGAPLMITRKAGSKNPASEDQFLALSSVCPHLGCRVHWEPQFNRFFCPCHNGAFDAEGVATEGPPEKAGQRLKSYELSVDGGMLFIHLPFESLGQRRDLASRDRDWSGGQDSSREA